MKKTLLFMVLSIVLLTIVATGLLTTEPGTQLIARGVTWLSGDIIQIGRVEGALLAEMKLGEISITTPSSDISIEAIETRWGGLRKVLQPAFEIKQLSVVGVKIISKDEADGNSGEEFQLVEVYSPIELNIQQLILADFSMADQSGEENQLFSSVSANVHFFRHHVNIAGFQIDSDQFAFTADGSVETIGDWQVKLAGNCKVDGFGFKKTQGNYNLVGPLHSPQVELQVTSPSSIRVVGQLQNLLDNPAWSASLVAGSVDLSALILNCPEIQLARVTATIEGDTTGFGGYVEADGLYDKLDDLQLQSSIKSDWLGIQFESLQISRKDSFVRAEDGWISWKDIFSWGGNFEFVDFDISTLPGDLAGSLNANFTSNGDVLENGLFATFTVKNLAGVINQQSFSASGELELTSDGIRSSNLLIERGDIAGLVNINKGEFNWSPDINWEIDANLEDFNPDVFYPHLTGSINSLFSSSGKITPQGLMGTLTIDSLSGTLLGNDLSGEGTLTYAEDQLQASGFILRNGPTLLTVDGQTGIQHDLSFSFTTDDLGTYLAGATGQLELNGSLSGASRPRLNLSGRGQKLGYQEYSVGNFSLEVDTELTSKGSLDGKGVFENISYGEYKIDSSTVTAAGNLSSHQVSIQLTRSDKTSGLSAKGGYDKTWKGEFHDFFIRTSTVDFVNQAGTAELAMSPSTVAIKDFCVMDRGAKLCLNGSVDLSDRLLWSVEGDAHDLDLAALNRWGVTQLPVTGSGTVNFEFQGDGSKPLKGDVVARFSEIDFDISELSDEIEKYRINDCNFKMQFEDSILNSLLALNLASGGSLLFDVSTNQMPNDFNHIDEVKLSGSLLLDRIDMGLLSLITDHQLEATGISSGEFKLSGSLNTPQLSGTASLAEGEIAIPDFGITLQEIAVKLDADTDGVQVTGTTVSGKGMIELAGKIGFGKQGLDGHLQVTGNNFELVNLPEYTFLISPEVEVDFTGDSAHIKGLITVPEGVIYPEELRSSIKESSDVIFIDSRPEVKKNHWPIKADLDVQLGDDIAIDGYGLSGKLGGKLSVRTTPSGPFVGSGEIALTRGDFTFQNSVLEIERGRVLFTGGPLNNPGVDVRAKKQVRGGRNQIRGVTVGIEISGLVEDLQFQLFSDPYLDEGEILSYLMVGQDLRGRAQNKKTGRLNPAALSFGIQGSTHSGANYGDLFGEDKFRNLSGDEKENTSVALGTNLTKGLFVSYDVNTFNQQGQFRVRYDMSRGFFIETRSSSETAGADLLYIFER